MKREVTFCDTPACKNEATGVCPLCTRDTCNACNADAAMRYAHAVRVLLYVRMMACRTCVDRLEKAGPWSPDSAHATAIVESAIEFAKAQLAEHAVIRMPVV